MINIIDAIKIGVEIQMKNILKVKEWNWRGATSCGWDNGYSIMPWMVNKVLEENPDVISINEFVVSDGWDYFRNKLIENGYWWFMTYTTYENGILIALKKDTFDIKSRNDISVTKQVRDKYNADSPDFLAITLKYREHPLTIIGTRIKVLVNSNNYEEDFKFRKRQFDALVDYISTIEGRLLVTGDFNNGAIFNEFDKEHIYNNCARQYYNYQMIWREVEDVLKLSLSTPDRGGKYGDKYSIVTMDCKSNKTYYTKEDHLISRGFETSKCDYSWDFVKPENGYENIGKQDYKGFIKFVPDHAILYSELVVESNTDYE